MASNIPAANVKVKRAYDPPSAKDGKRILVDRLWPRGISKEKAALDHWMKEIAPSTELRKWFAHDPKRWDEFRRRYAAEVRRHPDLVAELRSLARNGPITLVYAAHDASHNDAVVLRDVLLGRIAQPRLIASPRERASSSRRALPSMKGGWRAEKRRPMVPRPLPDRGGLISARQSRTSFRHPAPLFGAGVF
jgi:uncharacterized protein YeaO (DUF488 family)